MAFQPRNPPGHRILVGAHDLAQLFGIDPSTEVSRADKVDEHECELAALGRCGGPGRRPGRWGGAERWEENGGELAAPARWGGRTRGQVRWAAADSIENLPSVADGPNSNLLEIVNRQMGQHLKVDPVVPEHLFIGLQAEAAQPFSDIQLRLHGLLRAG